MNHVRIPIDPDDESWKERCSKRMKELENRQFPSQNAASQPELVHKELVGKRKVMTSELYEAVEKGDVENFVDALQRTCDERRTPLHAIFDQVTCAGDSLLHVAADHKGRERIAELICDHFPELLIGRNIRGDTPLHVAVRSKNSTIVKLILSHYARKKTKHDGMRDREITRETNKYENTPLHEAVYSGDVGVVKEILFADNDVVHYLNKSKRSPLYMSVVNGKNDVQILNLLLKIPFPADLPECLGNSPLHAALLERKPGMLHSFTPDYFFDINVYI